MVRALTIYREPALLLLRMNMITEVSIVNFKSIRKIEGLKLRPLTLFTGVNSSGKSNIMEAISFFAQASRLQETAHTTHVQVSTIYSQGDVRRYPHGELENFIAYKGRKRRLVRLEINVKPTKTLSENISSIIKGLRTDIPELAKITRIGSVGYSFAFDFESPRPLYIQRILLNEKVLMGIRHKDTPQAIMEDSMLKFKGRAVAGFGGDVFADEVFTPLSPEDAPIIQPLAQMARVIVEYIRERMKRVYFISGERGRIEPEVRTDATGGWQPTWIGPSGQFLIEILSRCLTRQPEETKRIKEWAQKFRLADIRVGYVGRNTLEANFTDDSFGVNLNSALAGLGSRQMLSIITQIFLAKLGSVIMIEEPEISLHPENQVLLHELFSEAISEGKQIICSTHSPFFILALSRIIKKKLLTIDKIAVYHVTKDGKGTHVKPLKLDKHGFVISGVPSFMKVEKELFQDWSQSLEEK